MSRKIRICVLLIGSMLVVAGTVSAEPAVPSTDIIVDGVSCTLAAAITNANNGDQSGSTDCAPGSPDADTLTLTSDINLSSALPEISSKITIKGEGHTIAGNDTFRIFHVTGSGDFALKKATVTDGYCDSCDGGGIYNSGTVR